MVEADNIEIVFKQQIMSCVLASYAIVANYYANTPVKDIFTAYCDHFGMQYQSAIDAENISASHLNRVCPIKGWQGYRMVKELHENSDQSVFKKNREAFLIVKQGVAPPNVDERKDLALVIRSNDSLLNILILVRDGAHSQTIGVDIKNEKEFLRDTGGPNELVYTETSFINDKIKEYLVYARARKN